MSDSFSSEPEEGEHPTRQLQFMTHSDIAELTNPMIPEEEVTSQHFSSIVNSSNLKNQSKLINSQLNPMFRSELSFVLSQDDEARDIEEQSPDAEFADTEVTPLRNHSPPNLFKKKSVPDANLKALQAEKDALLAEKEKSETFLKYKLDELLKQLNSDREIRLNNDKLKEENKQLRLVVQDRLSPNMSVLELTSSNSFLTRQLQQEKEERETQIIFQKEVNEKNLYKKIDELIQLQQLAKKENNSLRQEVKKLTESLSVSESNLEQSKLKIEELENQLIVEKQTYDANCNNLQLQLERKNVEINNNSLKTDTSQHLELIIENLKKQLSQQEMTNKLQNSELKKQQILFSQSQREVSEYRMNLNALQQKLDFTERQNKQFQSEKSNVSEIIFQQKVDRIRQSPGIHIPYEGSITIESQWDCL